MFVIDEVIKRVKSLNNGEVMQINQIINSITKTEEYIKLFPGESPYTPLAVGCEIDNICNADCSFCGYGKGADGRKKQFLNIKVIHS